MRRKVFVVFVGAVAVAFAGLALAVYALGATSPFAQAPEPTEAQQYTVRAEDGKVTVFPGDSGTPEIETEIDTSHLREYDKKLLDQGIQVEGYENMIGLLEDFSN